MPQQQSIDTASIKAKILEHSKFPSDEVIYLNYESVKLDEVFNRLPNSLTGDLSDIFNHQDILISAVKASSYAIFLASDDLLKNKEFILNVAKQGHRKTAEFLIKLVHPGLLNDEDVIIALSNKWLKALIYAGEELKQNRDVIIKAMSSSRNYNIMDGEILNYLPAFQNDEEIVFKLCQKLFHNLSYASSGLKQNRSFILKLIKSTYLSLSLIPEHVDDEEIVFEVCKKNSSEIQFASERLKQDRSFILRLIKSQIKINLQHFLPILSNDEAFVVDACQEDITLFSSINENLQNNPEIIRRILAKWNVNENSDEIHPRDNKELFIDAVRKNHQLLIMASDELRENKAFMLELVEVNVYCFDYVAQALKDNMEFRKEICLLPGTLCFFKKNSSLLVNINKAGWLEILNNDQGYLELLPFLLKRDNSFLEQAVKLQPEIILKLSNPDKNLWRIALQEQSSLIEKIPYDMFYSDASIMQEIYPIMQARVTRELSALGLSSEKIQQYFEQLDKLEFHEPCNEDIELYKQINLCSRMGYINPSDSTMQGQGEDINYSIETIDSFSTTDHALAKALKTDDNSLALFEFSIIRPLSRSYKGIIFNYYGGYGGHNFNGSSSDVYSTLKKYLEEGYVVISLVTQDNWQTLHQSNQTNPKNPAAMALLNQNLCQLFRFVAAIKQNNEWADLPVIYYGASFGGFYGGLINLLLSNKNNLHNERYAVLESSIKTLQSIPLSLFDAFIIHDGGVYINKLNIAWKKPINIPTLLLHNYDDERVEIDIALDFLRRQFEQKVNPAMIHFHMTPQGAKGVYQLRDCPNSLQANSSTDGHFLPFNEKYRMEYQKAVFAFLNQLQSKHAEKKQIPDNLSMIRYEHVKKLREDQIYRLYHALIRHEGSASKFQFFSEDKSLPPMLHRLGKCFSIMAHQHSGTNNQLIFKHIMFANMPVLVNLISRRKAMMGYLSAQVINRTKPNLHDNHEEKIAASSSTAVMENAAEPGLKFVLTEDAIDFLKTEEEPLKLIQRSRKFAKVIDKEVLRFFKENETINSVEDLCKLWSFDEALTEADIKNTLGYISRTYSIIKTYFPNEKSLALKLLITFQSCNAMYFFSKFGDIEKNYSTLFDIATKIMQQPAEYQIELIQQLRQIYNTEYNKHELLNWLCQIDPSKRAGVVNLYMVAITNSSKILGMRYLLRENTELLSENLVQSVAGLEHLENALEGLQSTSSIGISQ